MECKFSSGFAWESLRNLGQLLPHPLSHLASALGLGVGHGQRGEDIAGARALVEKA